MELPVLDGPPRFVCGQCGTCCSHLRGFIPPEDRAFVEEHGYGKLPLVQLVAPEEMSFPLWGFERERFVRYAEERGIDPRIEPSRAVLDTRSERAVIITYQMSATACPFLTSEKRCGVYGEERAFVCNLFPLNRTPFSGALTRETLFGDCGALVGIVERLSFGDKERLVRELSAAFPSEFLAALQHERVTEWSNRMVLEMIKRELIAPAKGVPYRFLKRRIAKAPRLDLFDAVVEMGMMTAIERDRFVADVRSYDDARRFLASFIKSSSGQGRR